jgi:pseudaminic acid synthase
MRLANKEIGKNNPCFIIAELSANHNGNIDVAKETIRAAKKAGADAVKLQTYTPDTITINCENEYFKIENDSLWDGKTLYELYREAYTPWEWHKELFEVAKEEDLICFSSPFDFSAVDFLENLNAPAYKIASFEIQDIPLIAYTASKGKPIIISTGIAEEKDISLAVSTCKKAGNKNVVLLKCTSSYPAPFEIANLNTIPDLKNKFGLEVGFSDHTYGYLAPVIAVTLGAKVIEKHFILNHSIGGPDASFSLDMAEFTEMVQQVRNTEKLLGTASYELSEKVRKNKIFARSLFIVGNVKKGTILSEHNIRSIRPGFGMHPKFYSEVLGKKFNADYEMGTPLDPSQFS